MNKIINIKDKWWYLVLVVILLFFLLIILSPNPYLDFLIFAKDGIITTLLVTIISFIIMIIIGLLTGIGRISSHKLFYVISSTYVEIIRGIPLLVQLLTWYFCLPYVLNLIIKDVQINPIITAVIGLSVCYGAYFAEIVKTCLMTVPQEQIDAARALGLNDKQVLLNVILPQGLRFIVAPACNEFISMLKDSSLVSAIAITDLTRQGKEYMSVWFNPIEVWTEVALIYLIFTLIAARISKILENKYTFIKK